MMQPFFPAEYPPEMRHPKAYMDKFNVGLAQACQMVEDQLKQRLFLNDIYQVTLREHPGTPAWPAFIHLSIKRIDKEVIHDWRAMQEIKNMLVGPENEGIEIYPAESRLTDMSNQYHCWVFSDPTVRIPVGWQTRMVLDEVEAAQYGAKQRSRA